MYAKLSDPLVQLYAPEEIAAKLQFTYLPQIAFENSLDHKEIRERSLAAWKEAKVDLEAEKFGFQYKELVRSGFVANMSIAWLSEEIGYGVFAEEDMPSGTYIGEYTGIVRKNDLRRCFEPLNNYLVTYPVVDEMGKNFFLDGRDFGNITRLINHSYHPNLHFFNVFYEGFYHRIFLTARDVRKGEQLFFDYGRGYWNARGTPLEISLDATSLKGVSSYCVKDFAEGKIK